MAQNMMGNLQAIVQNTAADSIKMIDIDELHASPDNFFAVENIEELAETILGQGGIKDNLLVVPMKSGGYEIVSGHRRTAAVRYLLERGENISRYLPCLVQNYWDEADKQLDMILLNVSSRKISDAELLQSYEILNRILQEKKSSGRKFGRVREKLAEMLGVSTGQVSKIENVMHNAVPPVVKAVQDGELSINTANEIARMDAVSQLATVQNGLETVSSQEIREKQQKRATNGKVKPAEKRPPRSTPPEKLLHFIHEHYFDLESLFANFTADQPEEAALLENFKKLLYEAKEYERSRARLDS